MVGQRSNGKMLEVLKQRNKSGKMSLESIEKNRLSIINIKIDEMIEMTEEEVTGTDIMIEMIEIVTVVMMEEGRNNIKRNQLKAINTRKWKAKQVSKMVERIMAKVEMKIEEDTITEMIAEINKKNTTNKTMLRSLKTKCKQK